MRHLLLLALNLCFGAGCASQGGKSQWDEVWKDARGDNMKMHSDFTGQDGE